MRSLFIVISKIYGMVLVLSSISQILVLLPMIRMFGRSGAGDAPAALPMTLHDEEVTLTAISLVAMVVIKFVVAWLLIFRTEWLAEKLKVPEPGAVPIMPVKAFVYVGAKLIGLFLVVQGLPLLAQALAQMQEALAFGMFRWSSVAASIMRIIVGAILVVNTNWIVRLIMGREGQKHNIEATP